MTWSGPWLVRCNLAVLSETGSMSFTRRTATSSTPVLVPLRSTGTGQPPDDDDVLLGVGSGSRT